MAFRYDPQFQEALAARLEYYRDLGVYDLYRRGDPLPEAEIALADSTPEAIAPSVVVPAVSAPEPVAVAPVRESQAEPFVPEPLPVISTIEESEIPPRKPFPPAPPVGPAVAAKNRVAALQAIRDEIGDCTRCPLSEKRNKIVFADGDPNARLLFVGEGPGADEDAQGLPFVGRAGQLLNNMIGAMGLSREQVYIANIVKCRPPQNRVPEPVEAHTCSPFLFRQIDVVRPEVIVALGATAATYLLGAKAPLASLRGRIHQFRGTKLIVTYHPAFLLRDPRQKRETWKDLQIAMVELGLPLPKKPVE